MNITVIISHGDIDPDPDLWSRGLGSCDDAVVVQLVNNGMQPTMVPWLVDGVEDHVFG